jgi:hypothetical protein
MFFIFLLLTGLIVIIFMHKAPREATFQDATIYGDIKSILEISYKAKSVNGVPTKIKRWRRGHLTDDFHCFFDLNGRLIREIVYPAADTGTRSIIIQYLYNNSNELIAERINGNINKDELFIYDSKNRLVKKKHTLGRLEYDYYPDSRLHHQLQIDNEMGKEFLNTYSYKDNYLHYDHLYYYGAKWHLIDEYDRDNSGNVIRYRIGSSWEDLKKSKWDEFEYEFDSVGNWIKCVHFRNNKPIYIIERSIEYC